MTSEFAGRRVLVTGAASGIGAAIAERFSGLGARVLSTDIEGTFFRLDVTSDDDWAAAREWCDRNWGGLDILVNNAGVAAGGRIEDLPIADWQWLLDINLMGAVRGCATFVPTFKRQGHGRIVNIASLAALATPPRMSAYNVSKSALLSLSDTLRAELEPDGIGVTVVCPSFVRTNLAASARGADERSRIMTKHFVETAPIFPKEVAARVADGVAANDYLVTISRRDHAFWIFRRVAPTLAHKVIVKGAAHMERVKGPADLVL